VGATPNSFNTCFAVGMDKLDFFTVLLMGVAKKLLRLEANLKLY